MPPRLSRSQWLCRLWTQLMVSGMSVAVFGGGFAYAHVPQFETISSSAAPKTFLDVYDDDKSFAFYLELTRSQPARTWQAWRAPGERLAASVFVPITSEERFVRPVLVVSAVPTAACPIDLLPIPEALISPFTAQELADSLGGIPLSTMPVSLTFSPDVRLWPSDETTTGILPPAETRPAEFEPFGPSGLVELGSIDWVVNSSPDDGSSLCPFNVTLFFPDFTFSDPGLLESSSNGRIHTGFVTGFAEAFSAEDLLLLPVSMIRVHLWERQAWWVVMIPLWVFFVAWWATLLVYTRRPGHTKRGTYMLVSPDDTPPERKCTLSTVYHASVAGAVAASLATSFDKLIVILYTVAQVSRGGDGHESPGFSGPLLSFGLLVVAGAIAPLVLLAFGRRCLCCQGSYECGCGHHLPYQLVPDTKRRRTGRSHRPRSSRVTPNFCCVPARENAPPGWGHALLYFFLAFGPPFFFGIGFYVASVFWLVAGSIALALAC
jgi:hypothetical protein